MVLYRTLFIPLLGLTLTLPFFSIPFILPHNTFNFNKYAKLLDANLAWRADIITPPAFSPLLFDMNGDSLPELIISNATHIMIINISDGKVLLTHRTGLVMSIAIGKNDETTSYFVIFASIRYVWEIWGIYSNATMKSVYWFGYWACPSVVTVDLNKDGFCDVITQNGTGFVLAINGGNNSILWQRLVGERPYATIYPAVADLNNDGIYE
ncbi:MAG: FG-GAP repeat domain-containing protein, partial [Candidatus Njordarchaeales archaeon]